MKNNIENNGLSYDNSQEKNKEDAYIMDWIENNKGLIHNKINSYVNNNSVFFSKEDVEQEAYMTVVQAHKQYDPSKGASFSTYVCASITNNLNFLVRKERAKKRTTLDGKGTLSLSGDGEHGILDIAERVNSIAAKEDLMDTETLLKNILDIGERVCTADERAILDIILESLPTGKLPTQKEMADEINCSQSNISTKSTKLQKNLGTELCNQGFIEISRIS